MHQALWEEQGKIGGCGPLQTGIEIQLGVGELSHGDLMHPGGALELQGGRPWWQGVDVFQSCRSASSPGHPCHSKSQ